MPRGGGNAVARECRVFTRYLIRAKPSAAIVARYSAACGVLLGTGRSATSLEELVRRHPALLGIAEAGCGFVARDHALRKKLLILTAILEATPEHADRFLPPRGLRPLIHLELLLTGMRAALKTAVGIPLVLMVGGR